MNIDDIKKRTNIDELKTLWLSIGNLISEATLAAQYPQYHQDANIAAMNFYHEFKKMAAKLELTAGNDMSKKPKKSTQFRDISI